ncbi:MAG TPA: hypothetical protein VFN37_03645 [Candidatus Baltobacteraceae bacterium]|nr:hypothetical protein [Candidatus Baltobacteraceae bacterium]
MRISEYASPVTPQYLAVAPDGAAYTGYGANGSGSNLYRDANGSFTHASPAGPPSGYEAGGGVYGIAATGSQVYWLSAYGGPNFQPYVAVECGGTGTAALCEPTVDEPTTMLVDAGGTFWVGGWSYSGGGMIATSAKTRNTFNGGIVQLLLGPDKAVWGALQNYPNYAIARFSDTNGTVSIAAQFALPSGDAIGSMTYGGDGALWFTDPQRNAIGRMDAAGNLTEYPLTGSNALGQPWYGVWQITTACDGSVWFTEPGLNEVGRIDAHGAIDQFPLATPNAYPNAIASTGKCAPPEVWVAEQTANKLATISY